MALEIGGPGARKVKGGHYLVCQKKVLEAVLVHESKVVTKKRSPLSQFFPKIMVFSKKKVFTSNSSPLSNFSPKSWCSLKKKVFISNSSPFPNFFPKSWCSLKKKSFQ